MTQKEDLKQEIWLEALKIARVLEQIVGKKNNYYITLEQLENLLKNL